MDYPETAGLLGTDLALAQPWTAQLRSSLNLPVLPPDLVLTTLLERCQDIVQTSFKQGIRLVKAVEDLFPEQPQALEQIAGLVLTPAYRSGLVEAPAAELEALGYDQASQEQQIALSMLAAQEILSALSLTVSAQTPRVTRDWQTALGVVRVQGIYQAQSPGQLTVQAHIPTGGSLTLAGEGVTSSAQRSQAGLLSATLVAPQPNHPHSLEISLTGIGVPLQFALTIAME